MRILIYAQHFPPGSGGMEFSNFEIAKGLHNLGHAVEVVTVRNKGSVGLSRQLGFSVVLTPKWPRLKSYSLAGWSRLNWVFTPVYYHTIKQRIACFAPDVIFVADEASNCFWGSWVDKIQVPYVSYCSVPFVAVNETKGKRGILSDIKFVANSLIQSQFKRFGLKSYNSAKRIGVVSNSTREELLDVAPWLGDRMDVIPRSIDDSFFNARYDEKGALELKQKLGIDAGDFVILSVSNLEAGKGVDDVLRALALLRKGGCANPVRYIVVGDGEAAAHHQKLTQTLDLNDIVTFAGNIPHSRLIAYYDACNLFVLPSRRGKEESFGRVFAEAGARRRPSIGVNEGGMVDAVENGKTGFLVKAGAVHEIQERIAWFMANPDQTTAMGDRAGEFAEAHFRSSIIARALEMHLKWAIKMNMSQDCHLSNQSVAMAECTND